MIKQKVALIILDGWGHGKKEKTNAIFNSSTPFINSLYSKVPNSELLTHGPHVGLPLGQMGNSEVGHLNIGAGRIVTQELEKINTAVQSGEIKKNATLLKLINFAKKYKKPIHLMGLVSNGGIHSHQKHLEHLCNIIYSKGINKIFVHAFTDGRDSDPKSGLNSIKKFKKNIAHTNVKIASIVGRYYAMDRDKRWKRIEKAYNLLVHGEGEKFKCPLEAINSSYNNNITDEFILPKIICEENNPLATINNGDVVLCFNFRTDRCRQITEVLTQKTSLNLSMKPLKIKYASMTNYNDNFKNIDVLFQKKPLKNTLGEILSLNNLTQLRVAETEKYPHVTYFFSGGNESLFKGEKRILVNSPKVATYDLKPEMSALKVTNKAIILIKKEAPDFICLNFANPDMVGHTGKYRQVQEAVEVVDLCAKKIVSTCIKNNYCILLIADHGNAEYMINEDGSENTAHTTNLVPCFLINSNYSSIKKGKLGDISPTILHIMGINIPKEMTGEQLI